MPAHIEVVSMLPIYKSSQVIFPGYMWHFPLSDPIAEEDRLLVYRCDPSDDHASFYKTGRLDKLPEPEDLDEVRRLCTTAPEVLEVKNDFQIPLEEFLDRDIGAFTVRLAHTTSMTRN